MQVQRLQQNADGGTQCSTVHLYDLPSMAGMSTLEYLIQLHKLVKRAGIIVTGRDQTRNRRMLAKFSWWKIWNPIYVKNCGKIPYSNGTLWFVRRRIWAVE